MRTPRTVTTVASCFVALAFSFCAPEPKRSENANAYPRLKAWTRFCRSGRPHPLDHNLSI